MDGKTPSSLDNAIEQYDYVAAQLWTVASLYPWSTKRREDHLLPIDATSLSAIAALQKARAAEERGLSALAGIVAAL